MPIDFLETDTLKLEDPGALGSENPLASDFETLDVLEDPWWTYGTSGAVMPGVGGEHDWLADALPKVPADGFGWVDDETFRPEESCCGACASGGKCSGSCAGCADSSCSCQQADDWSTGDSGGYGSTIGNAQVDEPGCDWFPDTVCTTYCCAYHDACYDVHDCTGWSWLWNLIPWGDWWNQCAKCNADALSCVNDCINEFTDGVPAREYFCGPGMQFCYDDDACGGRYYCAKSCVDSPKPPEGPRNAEGRLVCAPLHFDWQRCECVPPTPPTQRRVSDLERRALRACQHIQDREEYIECLRAFKKAYG